MKWNYNPDDALNTESGEFSALPAGEYQAVLFDVAEKESKNTGAPMLELILDIYKDGKKVARQWEYFVAPHGNGKGTLWKMAQMAECMGPEFKELIKTGDFQPADYVDCRFIVELDRYENTWNGKTEMRNSIKKWVKCLSNAKELIPKVGASSSPAAVPDKDIPF